MTLYASRTAATIAAERLRLYAQPQRLMILSRLIDGEQTVSEIEEATGIGQPALSQQLAELRRAEIVTARRVSKLVYYKLADETVMVCVKVIEAMFGGDRDAADALTTVFKAPLPAKLASRPAGAAAFARIL